MMKRLISVILTMLMFFLLIPLSYAKQGPELVDVTVDGKVIKVKKINILINGEPIQSDVPPILYNSRTLVPVRFVANYLNADISWNQEKYEATIKTQEKEIILKINSSDVIINGKVEKLPYNVPAKLINDRTMVPLRFVSEALGFDVGWIPETWTGTIDYKKQDVTNVSIVENEGRLPKIRIETTGLVSYKDIFLEDPYRLVIDIPRSNLNIENKEIIDSRGILKLDVQKYSIKEIRASQFSINPDITRVVIELDRDISYNVNVSDKQIQIDFTNKVSNIKLETIEGKKGIVIYNTNRPDYNIIRLYEPDRIVVDLLDSLLEMNDNKLGIETEFIKGIRTSQFKPDSLYNEHDKIVRVVLDLKEKEIKPHLTTRVEDNKIILFLDDDGLKNIDFEKLEDGSRLLKIKADKRMNYHVKYDEDGKVMTIKFLKKYANLGNGIIEIRDELIDYIKVESIGDYNKVSMKVKKDILYDILSSVKDDEIKIKFNDKVKKYSDKLIVIDAGHGGKDPGTICPITKIKEKDLALKYALSLEKRLRELGFKTLLIRNRDEYIDLYDRAEKANRSNGDAFISIHFNAHDDKDISGIQTLYCPSYLSDVKTEDNYPFAETIHEELLKATGAVDRGIKRRPKLVVVRETKMVAVLLELGFVTNPNEEKRIITQEYKDKAIQGIVNGIIRYFESK